ncbi:hypothetical protein LWI28_001632 [Acer negundo]|uniref:Reverse transcriptase zinc-binding domain-containing protein n=1 Tax=Acer negundo TaxID=4023 RepID=A0AAD5NMM0_ACENE|nr:hypothetical protein LWI28_001632 [Acer negundo]
MKSGNWVAKCLNLNPSCSRLNFAETWWKFFWRLHLPSKVKIFFWKACNNWIPARVNIFAHGMKLIVNCPFCLKKAESTLHALCNCSLLKELQAAYNINGGNKVLNSDSFLDFVISCYALVDVRVFKVFCVMWW